MQLNFISKSVIFIQIILIIFLGLKIYNQKNNILGTKTSISYIDKSTVTQFPVDNLKYFYNLNPNKSTTWSAAFLPKPITNKYNSDGLNDTKNYPTDKEPNTFRIITLGDSFTYGQNVKTKDNWTELLEKKLNEKPICKNISKFEVINLGAPGYDIQYEIERYRLTGQKYNPDLIIWMLTELDRMNESKMPLGKECIKNHPDDIPKCWDSATQETKKRYGIDYIINQQKNSLNTFKDIYNKNIFFIDYYNSHQKIINGIKNSSVFSQMLSHDYLFKNNTYQEVHFPDAHPNNLGHQLIANIIFDQLLKTKQIPCQSL